MLSKLTLDPFPPQKKFAPPLKSLDFPSKHCILISMPICIFSKFMIFCTNVLIYTPKYLLIAQNVTVGWFILVL